MTTSTADITDATAVLIAVIIAADCRIIELDYARMGEVAEWRLGLVRKGQGPLRGRYLGANDLETVLRKGARWAMGTEPLQDTSDGVSAPPGGVGDVVEARTEEVP